MATFPEFCPSEIDKRIRDNEWSRQWLDAMVQYRYSKEQQERLVKIQRNYDTHNGEYTTKFKEYFTKNYGKTLSTTFVPFHLARTKEKLLFGEMLDIGLKATIETINPEALAEKMNHVAFIKQAMQFKPVFQQVEQDTGIKPFNGMPIPDPGTPEAELALKPKRRNEIVMQRITDKKIEEDMIKVKLYQNMTDLVLTSECHGVVERTKDGIDTYRVVSPKYITFQEDNNDPFCLRTPFVLESRLLYKNEIFSMFPDMDSKMREYVNKMGVTEGDSAMDSTHFQHVQGQIAIMCYYGNWKTSVPVYVKIGKNKKGGEPYVRFLDPLQYEKYKSSFDRDEAKDEFKIEKWWRDEIWEGWRIGAGHYYGMKPKEFIQQRLINGKYRTAFDYTHCLYGTVDGKRISLEEMIHNLSEVHDLIMHIIKREVKKVKGKVYTYDEKFIPQRLGNMSAVMYDVVEHGVIQFNSAVDGIESEQQIINAAQIIQSIDLGLTQSFEILLTLKNDIQNTIDKLTGINETREGLGRASATATGTMQNIEASRSITKDLFFMLQVYSSIFLTKMVDKVKINWDYLKSLKGMFLDDDDMDFLKITEDICLDEFAAYFSDGREYNEVKQFAMQLFPQEINAGNLRTKDAIRFKSSQSLAEGLQVLDRAWDELEKVKAQLQQQEQEAAQAQLKAQADATAQEKNMDIQGKLAVQAAKDKSKAGVEMMKTGAKGMMETNKIAAQSQEQNPNNPPPQLNTI